jgi:hypothetical protein
MPADRETILKAVDELLDALARERQANSDDARQDAQEAALAGWYGIMAATGMLDLLQRRVVAQVRGLQSTADVAASTLPAVMGTGHGLTGARAARNAAFRVMLDSGILPEKQARLIAAALHNANAGRTLFDPEPVTGVDPSSGPYFSIREALVNALGYEAGVTGCTTRLLPHRNLVIARRHYMVLAEQRPGVMPQSVSEGTIRDWCARSGELQDVFQTAYRQGLLDEATGNVKPELRLSGLRRPQTP